YILFLLFSLFYSVSFAQQSKIDSLSRLIELANEDSTKVKLLNKLFGLYEFEDASKAKACLVTAEALAKKANYKFGLAEVYTNEGYLAEDTGNYNQALLSYQKALKIHREIKNKYGIASAYHGIGILNLEQGNYAEALKNLQGALNIDLELKDKISIALDYNSIANVYTHLGNYANALDNQLKALKIREEIGDHDGIASSYIGIGNIQGHLGDHKKALESYHYSLKFYKGANDKQGISTAYANIGLTYFDMKMYPEGLKNCQLALDMDREMGDKKGMSVGYNNLACIYKAMGNYSETLKNNLASLQLKQEIGDKEGIAVSYMSLGLTHSENKNYPEARKSLNLALAISKEIGQKDWLKGTYDALARLDSMTGDFKSAYSNYKMSVLYDDSLLNEETHRKTIQTQMNYDFEKKEAIAQAKHNSEMEKQNAIAQEKQLKQMIILASIVIVLLLVAGFAFFIFRSLRVMEKQKHVIQEHQNEIIDSITYAKRLQDAILPSVEEIKNNFPESFILYKPKSIVAGDFYWSEKVNEYNFIAAADCTGHGVPGAMVSIICSNALERAVNEFGLTETGKILDKVRDLVLNAFKKSNEDVKDGMDISLCRINTNTNEVQWSGANNPLWYFSENELNEVKGDKQPIGKYDHPQPFITHTFSFPKGINLYMFSDGYADQFGAGNKKMTRKRFKEIVTSVQDKSMAEQNKILDDYFMSWKKDAEQIDDVCVIGLTV
ncbi:MAG: protein serine/threonine phosphatase, partial [Bacteroidota bacterium]|nr:protein serine/threonine phosphatase [Bacteroidota bacterium]